MVQIILSQLTKMGKRTFLEKVFLLHEEFQRPFGQIKV